MNPVEVGQTIYGFEYGEVREYRIEKVTAKQVKAVGPLGYRHTLPRTDQHPPGAVARDGFVYLWTTVEECVLAEVQRLNREISGLQEKADALTAEYLVGES